MSRVKLTDKQRKQIIKDFIECQNKSEVARKYGISDTAVAKIIKSDPDSLNKLEEKKQETTANLMQTIEDSSNDIAVLMKDLIAAMGVKAKTVDNFTNIKDYSTAFGTLFDKQLKYEEIAQKRRQIEEMNRLNVNISIPAKDISVAFVDLNRDIDNRKYLEYWLEGGRASLKSSFISEKIPEILKNNPNMCCLVVRRYSNTLKDSVFSQLNWGFEKLSETFGNIMADYEAVKSPMEIRLKETNQMIYFRGADDPGKIKSIKPPPGKYIGIIWYEEFDQMQGMESIRKINQSVIRGGNDFIIFCSYNTPPSRLHFVNKEKRIPKANRILHHSDYRSAPVEFLGQTFIDEAEHVKETNPRAYENEYLGLETGDGGNVFENLEIREITDEEISTFDRLYKGVDWGWYPDPFAYNNMHYDSARRTLYIFDELHCNKKSNRETADMLIEKGVTAEYLITADPAENKSIGDYKSYGFFIRGAIKGPGSVEYGMKWLQSLAKIVIDDRRCPYTTTEFLEYEYERDKEGNVITGYPDKNNHHIDDVRYAMESVWKRKGQ